MISKTTKFRTEMVKSSALRKGLADYRPPVFNKAISRPPMLSAVF
jgi:hypothetical protein